VLISLSERNVTWMGYPRDDFERNRQFTYDLRTKAISEMAAIKGILLTKIGNEGADAQAGPSKEPGPVVA
jgi:hypothetical protein